MDILWALYSAVGNVAFYVLVFLGTLSLVVFIHELGHFFVARAFGVRVNKFSIGFGRELWGFNSKSGVRWCLSRIPLGGYVEIFGYGSADEVLIWDKEMKIRRPLKEEEKLHAFCEKKLWQRALIVAAGPLINFMFAFFIFVFMFLSIGEPSTRPFVSAVAKGGPGYEAGIRPLDHIISLNGKIVHRFEDVWDVSRKPGAKMDFVIERDGALLDISVTSVRASYNDLKGIHREHGRIGVTNFSGVRFKHILSVNGVPKPMDDKDLRAMLLGILDKPSVLGVRLGQEEVEDFMVFPRAKSNEGLSDPASADYDFFYLQQDLEPFYEGYGVADALWYSGKRVYKYVDESVKFIAVLMQGKGGDQRIGGLVSMEKATRKAVDRGIVTYFIFLAALSVQIGFINLFPIPALDGGYLVFFAYEAVTGKALSERIQDYALTTGMILLFGLMIFANISDILGLSF